MAEETQDTADPAPEETTEGLDLQGQLDALKEEKKKFETSQVDANIADLQKLVSEAAAAKAAYDAAHPALKVRADALGTEFTTLKSALEAALPITPAEIKAKVKAAVDAVKAAKTDLQTAETILGSAQTNLTMAEKDLASTETTLAKWRKPVETATKRLDMLEKLLTEIKELRNNQQRAVGYWKLVANTFPELSEQVFAEELKNVPLLDPGILEAEIEQSWQAFSDARSAVAAAKIAVAEAEAEKKAKSAALTDKTKNLIKTITEALAAAEAPAEAT